MTSWSVVLNQQDTLYDSLVVANTDTNIHSLVLTQTVNAHGKLEFTVPRKNPLIGAVTNAMARVDVYSSESTQQRFTGVYLRQQTNVFGAKTLTYSGVSILLTRKFQRPFTYTGKLRDFLTFLITRHNSQLGTVDTPWVVGTVSGNANVNVTTDKYVSTWDALQQTLVKDLGLFITTRASGAEFVVDVSDVSGPVSNQPVTLTSNIMDLDAVLDTSTMSTRLIPVGSKVDDTYTTIAGVNGGKDYVQDDQLVSSLGVREVCVDFNTDDPTTLLALGSAELTRLKFANFTATLTVADLHFLNMVYDEYQVGARVPVQIPDFGISEVAVANETKTVLDDPSSSLLKLGVSRLSLADHFGFISATVQKALVRVVPGKPSAVTTTSWVGFDVSGKPVGYVGVSWQPVTESASGQKVSGVTYEVWGAPADGSQLWVQIKTSEPAGIVSYLPVGTKWVFRVRAITSDGQSAFSDQVIQVVAQDNVPPPDPENPIVTTSLGTVTVMWTGNSVLGTPMPVDTEFVEVWQEGVKDPLTRFGRLPDVTVFADLPHDVETRFRLRAIDTSGNKSGYSEWVAITPVGVADADLIGTMVAEQMSTTVSELQSLDQRVAGAETAVAKSVGDVADAMREVDAAKQNVAQATADVAILTTTTIPRLQSDLDANRVDVQQAKTTADGAKASADLLEKVTIPELRVSLADNTAKVIQAQTDVAKAAADIVDVNAAVSGLGSTLANVSSDLTVAKSDVTTLKSTTIPKLQTDLTANQTAVEKAQSSADEAKANVDQMSKVTIPALSKTLDDTALKVTQAQTDVTKATKDIVDVNSVVAGLGSDMAKVSSSLATAQADVATLKNTTVPKLQTDLTANQTAVQKAQTTADGAKASADQLTNVTIPALNVTLNKNTTDITAAQTDVAKAKTDIAAANTSIASINTKLTSVETDVKAAITSANGKTTTFYQSTKPATTGRTDGDQWYDTANGYRLSLWSTASNAWVLVGFGSQALTAAVTADISKGVQALIDAATADAKAVTAKTAADAAAATANSKRRNFSTQPVPPYEVGDTWTQSGVVKVCTTTRLTGSYTAGDWTLVATDDTTATAAKTAAADALTAANNKGKLLFGTTAPTTATAGRPGWTYWVRSADGTQILGQYLCTAGTETTTGNTWVQESLTNATIATLDAGKLNTGILDAARIAAKSITSDKLTITDGFITTAMIGSAQITGAKIASATIDTANIKSAAITTALIASAAVGSAQIADAAITTAKIGAAQITAAKIGVAAIETAAIKDGAITTAKIGSAQITNALIADATIQSAKIATLDAGKLNTGILDAARIAAQSITTAKLAITDFTNLCPLTSQSVGEYGCTTLTATGEPNTPWINETTLVRDLNIDSYFPVQPGEQFYVSFQAWTNVQAPSTTNGTDNTYRAVTVGFHFRNAAGTVLSHPVITGPTNNAEASALTTTYSGVITAPANTRDGQIFVQVSGQPPFTGFARVRNIQIRRMNNAELIVDGAVTAVKVAASAITTDKLAANAVTAAKIAANTITASQIASATITATQLAASSVTATQIATDAVTAVKIQAGAVATDKLAANAVTAAKIAANTITASQIASATITATQLAANSVTTTQLAANAVTAAKIAARAITADKIVVGSTSNLVPDPNFDTLADSSLPPAWVLETGVTLDTAGYDGSIAVKGAPNLAVNMYAYFSAGQSTWANRAKACNVNVQAGDKFLYSCWAKSSATCTASPGALSLVFVNLTDGTTTTGVYSFPANLGTTWTLVQGVITVPTGKGTNVGLTPRIAFYASIPTTTWASRPVLLRMNNAELIVDGAVTAVKVAASAITTDKLAANAVTAAKIAANTITASQIASATITATQLAASSVTATQIATDAVTAVKIQAGAVATDKLAANAVTAAKIAANTITASQIASATITATQLAANSVTTTQLSANAVTAAKIAANTITADKMVIGSSTNLCPDPTFTRQMWSFSSTGWSYVTAGGYSPYGDAVACAFTTPGTAVAAYGINNSIATLKSSGFVFRNNTSVWLQCYVKSTVAQPANTVALRIRYVGDGATSTGNLYVYAPALAANTWTLLSGKCTLNSSAEMVFGLIDCYISTTAVAGTITYSDVSGRMMASAELIVDGAVTAVKVAASAITTDKLAANAVTAAKIAANTITASQIASATITATQLAASSVTATQIATDAVTAVKIQAGAVATDKLAANAVTAAKIAANTITASQIASATITATQLAASSVTATQIATDAVTAVKIQAGAVATDKLAANAVTAAKIASATITATQLAANSVTTTQLSANAVTAAKIAARAITADKIVIGSTSNLVPDPNFDTLADSTLTPAWVVDAGITLVAKGGYDGSNAVTCTPNQTATKWANFTGGQSTWTTRAKAVNVAVQAGEKYQFSCWAKASATCSAIPGSLNLVYVNLNDNSTATQTVNFPTNLGTTWTLVSGVVNAATTLGTNMGFAPRIGFNANIAQTITVSTPILRRMTEGELIVDGAVTAAKIAASSVTADKIQAGAITTAKLAATAIDGMTITGATIRTTATANRGILINASSLTAFDGSGNKTVSIDGSTGSASLTGVVKTSVGADNTEMSGAIYGGRPGVRFNVGSDGVKPVIFAQDVSGNGYPQESFLVMGTEQTVNSTGRTELELRRRGGGFKLGTLYGPNNGQGIELTNTGVLSLRGAMADNSVGNLEMFCFGTTPYKNAANVQWTITYGAPASGLRLPFITPDSVLPVSFASLSVTSTGFTIVSSVSSATNYCFRYLLVRVK